MYLMEDWGSYMRVLFQIRPDFLINPAGDTIQCIKTKKYIENYGVYVQINNKYDIDLKEYDIVHLFNTTRVHETYAFFKNAKRQRKKVVLSTIYWDMKDYFIRLSSKEYENWKRAEWMRRELFKGVDMLLPNAHMEYQKIKENYNITNKYHVVPNGVDLNDLDNSGAIDDSSKLFNVKDFILCVARISPRKNQLNLINALKKVGIPLVLIGPINDFEYYKNVIKSSNDNVIFLNYIKNEQLYYFYKLARVHVLPSWFETPGLSSLEAASCGCNIVSTIVGTATEYFGNMAWYCYPDDISSIYNAVMEAYYTPKNDRLKNHIRINYTWDKAAQETLKAYYEVTKNSK